jgi:hypothetical protein
MRESITAQSLILSREERGLLSSRVFIRFERLEENELLTDRAQIDSERGKNLIAKSSA